MRKLLEDKVGSFAPSTLSSPCSVHPGVGTGAPAGPWLSILAGPSTAAAPALFYIFTASSPIPLSGQSKPAPFSFNPYPWLLGLTPSPLSVLIQPSA